MYRAIAVYRLRRSVGFDGGSHATTLSFASEKEEALRRFSKDGKPHRVQVVFADEARLAGGMELYPGNTADVSTLEAAIASLSAY